MKSKKQILRELDMAIDSMTLDEINQSMEELSATDPHTIAAEDATHFAARIQKLNKEHIHMNTSKKTATIAIIAAVITALGVTTYATGMWNVFSFASGDKFVNVRTTEQLTEQEAKALASDSTTDNSEVPEGALTPETEKFTFDSVEQASQQLDMKIPMPSAMPKMALQDATAEAVVYGDHGQSKTAWLNYSDEQGRLMGITVSREIVAKGGSLTGVTTTDMDKGSIGSYKSKSGIPFTLFTESDESGQRTAHIATTMQGEYTYSLVFFGFDESQRQAIIDSVDLSVLAK